MPRPPRKKLGETLVEAGLIDELQLRSALADQKRWGNRLGKTLVKLGFVEEEPLMRQLSKLMGYPLAEIRGRDVDLEVLGLLPRDLAEKHRCLPLFVEDDGAARYLYLGMEEPADLDTLDALQLRTGFEICPVLIGFRELDAGLRRFYGVGGDPRVEPEDVPTGELVGPDCLRHGEESLASAAAPSTTDTASSPPSVGWAGPDPEESFEVGVNVPRESGVNAPREPGVQAPPTPATAAPPSRARPAGEVPTRRILQALTQVLVEKGVLTRAELIAQVNELTDTGGD